jgi:hypothetical protein
VQQPPIHPYYLHVEKNLQALWDHQHQLKQQLEEQIHALQQENAQLLERVSKMKCVNIENINYKIQELTVQQLSGTLNIGMSALTDPEEINKWLSTHDLGNELDEVSAPRVDP